MIFPNDLKLSPTDIEERAILRDRETQLIRSRVGITLSLYFLGGQTRGKRRKLVDCLSEYLSAVGENITHFKYGSDGRLHKFPGKGVPDQYLLAVDQPADQLFYLHVRQYDRRELNDPKLYMFMAFGRPDRDESMCSGLKVYLPPSFVFEQTERFVELVRGWCDRLEVIHGSGGLGTLTNPGAETTGDSYFYPWLEAYPALDYDAMGSYFATVSKGGWERPRASNWLTVLGDQNVAALGGQETVARALTTDVSTIPYGQGIILLAGGLPALGSPESGGVPEAYRAVARLVMPIRFEDYRFGFIKLPSRLNTGKEARLAENLRWLRRLD